MSLADQQWCPTSVQVTVLQARGLRVKGKSGTNDAYALMQVGKEKFQTSVVEKTVAPVWKEEATFDLPPVLQGGGGGPERCMLHVLVQHRALVGPDKQLGQAAINLLQLSEDTTRNKTEWFKLLDKTGKADKDRGEVLLDIQFMKNNMTGSMFDLSTAGKSRSRLGKFKDKVRGKKKESELPVVPSLTQVLTDSEEEEAANEDAEGKEGKGKDKKSKKLKMKSLFAPKSNLQRNMSQSMSVLPARNSSLSGSQPSGLNVESSEGKKKFKFSMHKRSGSSSNKDVLSGNQKQTPAEQSNLCINGSHVYCEEPPPRTSRIGSNFSLASSGHGSMEDVPESSPPSVDSLEAVKEYAPWMEEGEEDEGEDQHVKDGVDESNEEEEERIKMEEERRKEEALRRQQEEMERLAEEKLRREEEERIILQREEERKKEKKREEELEKMRQEEEERVKKEEEEEERVKKEEEERIQREKLKLEEEERRKREEEQKILEQKIKLEEEEKRKLQEEIIRREEEKALEKMRQEEEYRLAEENRLKEESIKREEERAEKERRQQEELLKKQEEEKREEQRLKKEEMKRIEEEKARREKEEYERLMEEKRMEEDKIRQEEEKERIEEEKRVKEQEERRNKVEEMLRRQRLAEKLRQEEEERRVKEKAKREAEKELRREEEERIIVQREEERKREKKREEELEKMRQEEERRVKAEKAKREAEEELRREEEEKVKKEQIKRDEEKRRREEEEERARKEKEENERRAEEMRLKEEEEEKKRKEEEERVKERAERERKEEEARKLEKEIKTNQEQRATEKTSKITEPAEITSNPFEDFSPEDIPNSPPEPHGLTDKDDTVQRCQSEAPSARSGAVSADEKDLIKTQWEKRPAPQPPGRNPSETRRQDEEEEDASTRHLSEVNKQSKEKDVKTVSVPPQRSVQMIAPLNRSPEVLKNSPSEPLTNHTKATKHGKRAAPSRPPGGDEPPSKPPRDVSEMKLLRAPQSLNPFDDDELTDDATARRPPAGSLTANRDYASQAKIKSSKVARAPAPPGPNEVQYDKGDTQPRVKGHVQVQESPNKETEQSKMVACVKEEGPPVNSRRLLTVKPLNPLEQQQPIALVQEGNNKSAGSVFAGDQHNSKVEAVITGPYSQLTQEELISLVLKQEKQLSERDKKISELERYIDNLLVRVMEEQPSILMSLSALK